MARKSKRVPTPSGADSRNCHGHGERRGVATCDQSKARACAPHCATALLLAVLSNEPVAPRPGCCMLPTKSVPAVPKRKRRVPAQPGDRRIRPDTALVELHLAGDD
jgi:hypothetical protein